MYIKRLEIVGFKSFPERVLVPLAPGISAVVGPNGCGKSNIIDAIRWVMGEQSPKMLRGRNMDDVLFNGSAGRPASALAEVTLTLARDHDPAAGALAAETAVTRRLYRNGDSEYLLNKVPCRLKDVVHFFTDQGVGTRAYGIIEQGRVGWLVDARPEERRGLIDEAAGITRYKQQKKEAERKIESAEANLVNVSVIKAETRKQLDQITRAAAKAARFKALKEELRGLDLTLSAQSLLAAREKRRELSLSREEDRQALTVLLAEAEEHDLALDVLRESVAAAEKALADQTAAWHRLTAVRDGVIKEAEFARQSLARSEERRTLARAELARLNAERGRKLEEEARLTEDLGGLSRDDETARARAEELKERWRAGKTAFDILSRDYDQAETVRAAVERQAATLATELAGAESLLNHHRDRLAALTADLSRAEEAARAAEARLAEMSRQKEDRAGELAEAQERAQEAVEAARLAERDLGEAQRQATAAESRLGALTARLETLKGVKDNFGWYPQGVKALMAAPELKAVGLVGPLAECLRTPDGYEEAVEAALGERLAWLVVENREAAMAALDFSERHRLGRCGFLCRDQLAAEGPELTKALLGDFQLADDLAAAPATTEPVLTKTGRYAGRGLVAGGRTVEQSRNDAGLLARLKEVEALTRDQARLADEVQALRGRLDEAREAALTAQEEARAAEAARGRLAASLAETDKALALAASEAAQAANRRQTLRAELDKTEREAADLTASLAEGRRRRQEAEEAARQATARARELKETRRERAEALEELRTAGEEARAEAASAAEKLDRARHDLDRVTEWLSEVADRLAAREEEAGALGREIEQFTAQARDLEARAAAFPEQLAAAEADLDGARTRLDGARRDREAREVAARDVRRRREEVNRLLAGRETDLLAVKFALEKIEENLRREWRVVMRDPEAEPPAPAAAPEDSADGPEAAEAGEADQAEGEENAALEEETRPVEAKPVEGEAEAEEELAAPPAAPAFEFLDPQEWAGWPLPADAESRREALRGKIGSLGEVSLGAIEREAELRAEYGRYQSQYDDLTRAVADLKDSIARLNHTCKIRFAETFQAVDEKFREIFPILFEGGEGWLSLTDEGDPLESGVEIHVHPPGKKMLVMSLLSGGEKALTALALIFALYLIKPSPFCLLDETDAPLDEANIDRFNRLLRQLSRASQIIMVTHNKRTMQISHTLYGVTMETPGVSKLVGVGLAEAEALTADV